ncbi:MAG: SagB/ThcOx family dehydrogenase [Candidatus Aminicenantes bacterium]|jgi:SagB-type dehydrogenase family enzyme
MNKGTGDLFQKETQYIRGKIGGGPLLWHAKPKTYKHYPEAPKYKLEIPQKEGGMPLWEAINQRHSIRNFKDLPLKKDNLSQLLWATQGITHESMGFEFRAAPSAGALYPVETYLAIHNVQEIESGIYHYGVPNHDLEQLKKGDFREAVARAALDQDMAYSANVVFIWTAVFQRSKWKYDQRAYRYVYLDAGHIAQNLALAAVSLGLGTCQIGALYDGEVNALIEVDGEEESVVYMSSVGQPW